MNPYQEEGNDIISESIRNLMVIQIHDEAQQVNKKLLDTFIKCEKLQGVSSKCFQVIRSLIQTMESLKMIENSYVGVLNI